jgi:hypothetical protein
MPSLADIPVELLNPYRNGDFIKWLKDKPLDWPTARKLAHFWQQGTAHHLSDAIWADLKDHFTARHDA